MVFQFNIFSRHLQGLRPLLRSKHDSAPGWQTERNTRARNRMLEEKHVLHRARREAGDIKKTRT